MSSPATECVECAGRGWVVSSEAEGVSRVRRCSCHSRTGGEPLLAAGIPARYRACTLESFNTHVEGSQGQRLLEAKALCRRFVDSFVEDGGGYRESGLLFIGPPGSGKTHLAVAVLKELIATYGLSGRFVDFTALIDEIQATFAPDSTLSKRQILDPIQRADVVVLDELGAQKPSDFVQDVLYLVMNSRYAERRPTLFTSNYDLPQESDPDLDRAVGPQRLDLSHRIQSRLVSRLFEMACPVWLSDVADYRREIQMHQHRI